MTPAARTRRAGVLRQEVGLAACLWLKEMLRLHRERTRWAGAVLQPVIFWLIMGTGMAGSFSVPGSPVGALEFLFPGMLAMIVLFTTLFTTISVIDDRSQGFLQGVLVAPGSRVALVAGKVAGVTTLTLMQAAIFLVLAPLAGYRLAGVRWGALLLVLVVACAGLTAMNFTVAWLLDSVQAYHAIMSVVLIPLWFLSGALFPRPSGWLGVLMALNPVTYAVDGLRSCLVTLPAGFPGASLRTSLFVLVAFAGGALVVALWACRRPGSSRP